MMHDHPDSTLAILEAFPQDSLFTDEQRALYALLLTQARDKNYIDETCDSIVKIAVSFYATFNNKARLMMSLYYLARIQYNMGDYSRSIVNYDKAEKIAASIDDKFYLGTFSKCPYLNVI